MQFSRFMWHIASGFICFVLFANHAIAQDANKSSPIVLLQGLDRTTARTSTFKVIRNKSVFFGRLEIYMRYCKKSEPTEVPDNTAFLEIYEYPLTRRGIVAQSLREAELKDIAERLSEQERLTRKLQREKFIIDEYGAEILQEEFTATRVFSGWMVSSSPPLNPLEHPVYDVWVSGCLQN
ncbi:MAG: DUF2155 domain-containing protein [Alphaproteobacteria bacterium]|nr:DUF2155 domain-containing protein [Alphaproteobacteria bacterium]